MIGTPPARPIAEGLGAELDELPAVVLDPAWSEGHVIEAWREAQRTTTPTDRLVVAVWPDVVAPSSVVFLELGEWTARMETSFALWFVALASACDRCVDGGQVVAVTERPEGKDSAGWSIESAVADAVEVMVRSLALVHRSRGVRIHVVSTGARLTRMTGTLVADVVGAVEMLLGADAPGIDTAVIRVATRP
jgi:NAD(P)-dependent dehydrogenase (short-subunit alcohol dehydrogenase family)